MIIYLFYSGGLLDRRGNQLQGHVGDAGGHCQWDATAARIGHCALRSEGNEFNRHHTMRLLVIVCLPFHLSLKMSC